MKKNICYKVSVLWPSYLNFTKYFSTNVSGYKNLKQLFNNFTLIKSSETVWLYKIFTWRWLIPFVHCVQESPYFAEFRSSHPEMFLRKGVLKICGKFTGEPPCRSAKYPVNFLHIFRTPFPKNIYEGLL